ncbi:SlyX family protein [Marinibactrum halimedae]|uniref:Protein SlyX homolog n=1 Tax=Marinibactrum halimedae TaxID=1444977 RepID=A0AA37WLN3_9GAMM|nr:SlyX family protein [Marinibactrum halimedae]MCD9457960.1 SlyX family protein [Marinibactrum halimedae]GLS26209.1 hypothetical protein GCM10007877_19240 [Marinibactrum halimedae]
MKTSGLDVERDEPALDSTMTKELQEHVYDLQARVSFQEDTIAQLDEVIHRQDQDIKRLSEQLAFVVSKWKDLEYWMQQKVPVTDEKPPHY